MRTVLTMISVSFMLLCVSALLLLKFTRRNE
jgi:hypothetical protein